MPQEHHRHLQQEFHDPTCSSQSADYVGIVVFLCHGLPTYVMAPSFRTFAYFDHPYIVLSLQQVIPVLFFIFKKCFYNTCTFVWIQGYML